MAIGVSISPISSIERPESGVGSTAPCGWAASQRLIAAQQAAGDALRDQRIKELGRRLDTYQNGSVQMGEDLHELRAVVAPLPEKLTQLEQRDPTSLSFSQAARLVGMGASIDELTESCGLTQAEAELMSKMHKG